MKYLIIIALFFSTASAQTKIVIRTGSGSLSSGFPSDTSLSINNKINTKLPIADTANLKPRLYNGTNINITGTYPNLTISATGSGTPAGLNKEIQFNDGGSSGTYAGFEFDKTTGHLFAPHITWGGGKGKMTVFGSNVYLDAVDADAKFRFRTDAYTAPIIGFAKGAIGIGNPNPDAGCAALHIDSWGTGKGIILPGLTKAQRSSMNLATITADGRLMIYQTDSIPGVRIWNGTNWMRFAEIVDTVGASFGSYTLDFGSTAAATSTDLTVTVTGAADGDVVTLGVPNSAVSANSAYTAWVSSTNTVTVRFNNYQTVGAIDPASATFKVRVIK